MGTEKMDRGSMSSKSFARLAYDKGMFVLIVAWSYQAVLEVSEFGHRILTYLLIEEGILQMTRGGLEDRDGHMLIWEWLGFATEQVPQMQVEKMR